MGAAETQHSPNDEQYNMEITVLWSRVTHSFDSINAAHENISLANLSQKITDS